MTDGLVMIASHDPRLIVLSVLISILAAYAARALTERVHDAGGRVWLAWLVGGATVDGIGTWSMHYTAMAAITFTYVNQVPDLSHAVSIAFLGILGFSIVPVMVLVVALLTSLVDRLQKQRALLNELFEQAPQAVAYY